MGSRAPTFSNALHSTAAAAFPLNGIGARPIETAERDLAILRGWLKDMDDG
jgi:hypothetical protein